MKRQFEEQPHIDWVAVEQMKVEGPATVGDATLALVALGASGESLSQLHARAFDPGTAIDVVPTEVWELIIGQMNPQGVAAVSQLNRYFHQLVRQGSVPVADVHILGTVHVYNAAQIATTAGMGEVKHIAVHAGIDGAQVGAAAAQTLAWLHLGPGVAASGITGGKVTVESGGTASGITGGKVTVLEGGAATGITSGTVTVLNGGTASAITGGTVEVSNGGTATGITGGTVVLDGGKASGITGGWITVHMGGIAQVPADIVLHNGDGYMFYNGADEASSALVIDLTGGGDLVRG